MGLSTVPGAPPGLLLLISKLTMLDPYGGVLSLRAKESWGGAWWMLWMDGVWSAPFIVDDDSTTRAPVELRGDWASHSLYAVCLGRWSYAPPSAALDVIRNQFEATIGTSFDLQWPVALLYDTYGDTAQLSGWSLTGIRRHTNCTPVTGWATRARCALVISTDGGDHTISLYAGGLLVASGTRTGDGEVTLSAVGSSGLSGTVTLAYTADIELADGAFVEMRWPAAYYIYEGTELLYTVYDTGNAQTYHKRVDGLGSGSHDLRLKVLTDTGQVSDYGTAGSGTLYPRPPTPTSPAYLDGDWTDTRVTFTSPTPVWAASTAKVLRQWIVPSTGPAGYAYECTVAGTTDDDEPSWPTTIGNTVVDGGVTWTCRAEVTFRVYDSALGEPPDLTSPAKTASASASTVTVALDSLAAEAAGVRRLQIKGLTAGAEDPEGLTLELEYDAAGAIVSPGARSPTTRLQSVSGRSVTIGYTYDGLSDDVTAASVQLWLVAEGATPDWGSPDESASIDSADSWSTRRGTISATAGADGFYRYAVRIADAGGNLSPNTTLSNPVWLGTATPTAPTPTLEVAA